MQLTLTSEEHELLVATLEEHQRQLLREIAHASHHQFKTELKTKEELLESIMGKLGMAQRTKDAADAA